MELAPGERPGTIHVHHSNFCYNPDGKSRPGMKYRCVKKSHRMFNCGAVLIREQDGSYSVRGEHQHAPTPHCALA